MLYVKGTNYKITYERCKKQFSLIQLKSLIVFSKLGKVTTVSKCKGREKLLMIILLED